MLILVHKLFDRQLVLLELGEERGQVGVQLCVFILQIIYDPLHFLNPQFQIVNPVPSGFQVIRESFVFVLRVLPVLSPLPQLLFQLLDPGL